MISILLAGCALLWSPGADEGAKKANLSAYQDAKTRVGRDADAHLRLALWCEAHGLSAERIKHLSLAILIDPENATARGLLGLVSYRGKWQPPGEVVRQIQEDPPRKALLQDYLRRRARTPDTADDQWKLALWCEESGLKEQATAHLYQVLKREPGRDAAWRRLGFKKVGGRWVKPEVLTAERAELEAQNRANKFWKPRLEHWRNGLGARDRAKRAEAVQALGQITDPRAVPMVWAVFSRGDDAKQQAAVTILGQIDAPGSSRALALLGLFSPSATVRQTCTEILRRRDPREFAGLLVAMIRDPVKYRVRPVGGPGSAGVLTVEGNSADTQRQYSPPPSPVYIPAINDTVWPDAYGQPVVYHPLGFYSLMEGQGLVSDLQAQARAADALSSLIAQQRLGQAGQQAAAGLARLQGSIGVNETAAAAGSSTTYGQPTPSAPHGTQTTTETYQPVVPYAQIPVGQMMAAAEATAYLAQQQLAADVRSIEDLNATIADSNSRALQMLGDVSGQNLGPDRSAWDRWLTDLKGYAYVSPPTPVDKPTYVEDVPISVVPQPPVIASAIQGPIVTVTTTVPRFSCFASGTLVWTQEGKRPIEQVRYGDQVLTVNSATGVLGFQPVVTIYHNPPNATYRIDLGGESIVATGIHRFWKAGVGWVMARELKPGDQLRLVSGIVAVTSVKAEETQPVFNLQLVGGDSFFVGTNGVLAHDNSIVSPVEKPFDQVPTIADLTSPSSR